MQVDTNPVFVTLPTPTPGTATVINSGPSTAYYNSTRPVSSTVNEGSVASGASVVLSSPKWFVCAQGGFASLEVRASSPLAGVGSWVNASAYGAVGDGINDDAPAIQGALNSLVNTGGAVFLPPGTYKVNTKVVVPGGCELIGSGIDYATIIGLPARASIIKAGAAISGGVVELGDDLVSSSSGKTGPSITDCIVDGGGFATTAIKTVGRRAYIQRCQAWRGTTHTVDMAGQNGYLLDSVIGLIDNASGTGSGSSVRIQNFDNKVYRNNIREGGLAQVYVDGGTQVEISHNHIFGGVGGTLPRHDIYIDPSGATTPVGFRITDNTIEATGGDSIRFIAVASNTCRGLLVANNTIYQTNLLPGDTYNVLSLNMNAASSILRQVVVEGNIVYNTTGGSSNYWHSFIEKIGSNTLEQVAVYGNQMSGFANTNMFRGFTPDCGMYGNSVRYFDGSTTKIYKSDDRGRSTQNGTGAQTAFTIPHNLIGAPNNITVTPGSVDARALFHVTADATNITVTFAAAPASGTNNVVLNWVASL